MDSGGIDPAVLDRALATLNRRGPDGSGTWTSPDRRVILGHRRLAILDPSFRGEEPSFSPDGQSVFVHNGEIYNFRSLRECLESRGETFVSESDGEVAHRLLRQDGPEALGRIEGMFARALWNGTERTLLLARDRIGIKPLYTPSSRGASRSPRNRRRSCSCRASLPASSRRPSPTSSLMDTSPSTAASSPAFANSLPLTG